MKFLSWGSWWPLQPWSSFSEFQRYEYNEQQYTFNLKWFLSITSTIAFYLIVQHISYFRREIYYYIPHAMEKHWFQQWVRWCTRETVKRHNCFRIFLLSCKWYSVNIIPCGCQSNTPCECRSSNNSVDKRVSTLGLHSLNVQKKYSENCSFFMKYRCPQMLNLWVFSLR